MLYGMEEFDDEFGLIKQETINVKKVSLVVVIVVLCVIVFSFFIIPKIFKNDNKDTVQGMAQNPQNQINNDENLSEEKKDVEQKDKNVIAKVDNKNKKGEQEYNGTHKQIAEHSMQLNFLPVQNVEAHNIIKDIYFSDEKQVYLTFDDGPSKDITPQILDILKENDVKATFFVLGARVDLYPDTLKREFNEGHYIANHGYSHKYSEIYQSRDTVFDEYNQCEDSIRNALGNGDYKSFLFRFPGGSRGRTL